MTSWRSEVRALYRPFFLFLFNKGFRISATAQHRINEQITVKHVRVVDGDGEMQGVLTISEALRFAQDRGLDLVEVAPEAEPPVCRLMDFGKQKYREKKKLHDARKQSHATELKEIWLRPRIDTHDLNTKLECAKKFLEQGFKVQITMRFRGREMARRDIGIEKLAEVSELLKEHGKVESEPRTDGQRVRIVIAALKKN